MIRALPCLIAFAVCLLFYAAGCTVRGWFTPRPHALGEQDARQQQAEGRRGGFIHHDNAGAA